MITSIKAHNSRSSAWSRFLSWARFEGFTSHVILILMLLLIFIPMLWMIGTTFKSRIEFATHSGNLIPTTFTTINYEYMLTAIENLPIYMRNSFVLAFGTTILQVFFAALAGYAFARMKFRFRDLLFLLLIFSMFIPRANNLMSVYELMVFLHIRNTLGGLVLLFASGMVIPIFIMRQSFLSVPKELEESAFMDGANWFQVFWYVALPLASGGMVVIATLSFIGVWADYLTTYTLVDKDSQMTISVGVNKILASSYETALTVPRFRGNLAGEATDATALLFAAIPVIIFYALLQRWFMKGLMEGALKF